MVGETGGQALHELHHGRGGVVPGVARGLAAAANTDPVVVGRADGHAVRVLAAIAVLVHDILLGQIQELVGREAELVLVHHTIGSFGKELLVHVLEAEG